MLESPQNALDNVLSQLRAEHDEIQALLCLYAGEPSALVREHLLARICTLLRVHCILESGIVVPAVAEAMDDTQLLRQTGIAYARVTGIINELSTDDCRDDERQRLFEDLCDFVSAHIEAAESADGFLAHARQLSLDWAVIERTLASRRTKLVYLT